MRAGRADARYITERHHSGIGRSLRAANVAVAAAVLFALPAPARAEPYGPPPGKVFNGITGGLHESDFRSFARLVGAHPAIFQYFLTWGDDVNSGLYIKTRFDHARHLRARVMLHVSTVGRNGREAITPGAVARGRGDRYLIRMNRLIADSGQIAYLRLMGEMNAHWNVYSAYDSSGRARGPDHSTRSFRRAWRRMVLIIRGGDVAALDSRLRDLGMPPVRTGASVLPAARVAFLWTPQVAGAPATRANSPRAYWPGAAYVDWVGTDFYSGFPNFAGLNRFYRAFSGKPFAFGEWGVWRSGDDAGFVRRFFAWVRSHKRTGIVMYNQGNDAGGALRLQQFPSAASALGRALDALPSLSYPTLF